MVIIDIFAVVEEALYSVQFEDEEFHEMERIFDLWNDPQYLTQFFEENIEDLQNGFFGKITVDEAVKKTFKEAQQLEDKLFDYAESGKTANSETLSDLFQPLSPSENHLKSLEKSKAKSSWLRIYAVRLNTNVYVVSGGAIKLRKTMNDRDHLITELSKLEIVKRYLEEDDEADAIFFELSLK